MPVNNSSIRLQILQAMKAAFVAITPDQPADDPMGWQFTTVAIGPLSGYDQRKQYSLGIVAGPEKETFLYPYITCWLTLNIEFRVTVNRGDAEPGVLIEQLLTVVKRKMTSDRTWGNRAIDTKVIGSEVDLITYADRSAVGVCMCEVQYRYNSVDPRNPLPY